jgi:protein disulfide-isomerase
MPRSLRSLAVFALLLTLPPVASAEGLIHWAPSVQAAVEAAARNNQLVLIHFWAPNCPPCRALERNVFSRDDVAQAIHRDYVAVKVNADAMPELAERYQVDRWPMDVIVTPAGYAVHRMVSPQDPQEYIGTIGRLAAERRPGVQLASNAPRPDAEAPAQRQFQEQPRQPQGNSRFSQFSSEQPQTEQFASSPTTEAAVNEHYANPYVQPQQAQSNHSARPPYEGDVQRPADPRGPIVNSTPPQPQQSQNPYVNQGPSQSNPRATSPQPNPQASGKPPMGLDGYCPVTLVEQTKWVRGDARFGIVHRGHVYLFTSESEKQRFWQDPDRYAPILSGNDPVVFAEEGQIVAGNRRHGVFFRNQIFLFASEENLQRFWNAPQRYADVAYQAMRRTSERR